MDAITLLLQEGARTIEQARALVHDSRALRTPPLMLVRGSTDPNTALIASLIADAALCGECIARRAGIPRADVDIEIHAAARAVQVTSTVAECRACLKQTIVRRLA